MFYLVSIYPLGMDGKRAFYFLGLRSLSVQSCVYNVFWQRFYLKAPFIKDNRLSIILLNKLHFLNLILQYRIKIVFFYKRKFKCLKIFDYLYSSRYSALSVWWAQSTGAVEYTDHFSAEGLEPPPKEYPDMTLNNQRVRSL